MILEPLNGDAVWCGLGEGCQLLAKMGTTLINVKYTSPVC
jgi:hypothetical protein